MLPLIAFAAGTALKAGGQLYAGQQEAGGLKRRAKATEASALELRRETLYNGIRYNEETRRLLSTQRAIFGLAGVTLEGAPENLLRRTKQERGIQRLEQAQTARAQVASLYAEAENYRKAATATLTASWLGAGSTGLAGASQFGEFK